ncbi:MAG: MerC domain-containing protein [Bacteroidetes bacterium]|nr:MerC domain-containing protein [Bacteroidota bacterium]
MSIMPIEPTVLQNSLSSKNTLLSRVSLTLSSVCLLHCLAMPFVIVLLPALSAFMGETVEMILILSIIPVSLVAFIPTWLKHKNFRLLGIFTTGLLLILLSQFVIAHHHDVAMSAIFSSFSDGAAFIGRLASMITGVSILAYATYRNNKHTHVCSNPNHHH